MLAILFIALLGQSAATPPAADPAVVEMAMAAGSETDRTRLFDTHPEIIVEPTRLAISNAAIQAGRDGDAARALNAHRTLLLAAQRANNRRVQVIALGGIGSVAGQRGDFATAEPALTEACAIAESLNDPSLIIGVSTNLGIIRRQQGRFDEAIASYERSIAAAEAVGRRDSIARALNNIGAVAQEQGDLRKALDYFTRSVAMKEELNLTGDLITGLFNIGTIHLYQRNFGLALDYFERARAKAVAAGDKVNIHSTMTGIGEIHMWEGRYRQAREILTQALAIAEAAGNPLNTAQIWRDLSDLALYERRWADADTALTTSLTLCEAAGDRHGTAQSLVGLADLALTRRQPERALAFAERGVAIARPINVPRTLWSGLFAAGRAHAALGRPEAAVAAYQDAIAVIEGIRRHVAGGELDLQHFFENKIEPYYELAATQAARGRPADAFAAVERARARVLLDLIDSGHPIVGALTDAERQRELELDRGLVALNAERAAVARQGSAAADRLRALDETIARARRARDEFHSQTNDAHPDLRFSRGEAPILSLDAAAESVPPGTAIVVFLAGDERVRLMLLTRPAGARRPSLRIVPIAVPAAELTRRALAFNRQVERRDLAFAADARALYASLLGPIEAQLQGVERLVIVPDGALWAVPFHALVSPRGAYVIEERAVSYAPSVSALARLDARRRGRAARDVRLVAIGAPPHSGLPEAVREVKTIAAMYGPSSVQFVGADATETRFRAAAPAASVLHIATHGELASESPMYSFVALGGDARSADRAADGRIEAWEIANLTLDADLAVLSACESARGGVAGGEGAMGLAWSLFAAGVSTAIVSEWRVDSASTTELMLAFHRAALSGEEGAAPADAMRAAARDLIASSQFRHPYYWAGFIVIGAP